MHTLLDLRGNIPSVIHITEGNVHDVNALDVLAVEPGATYVLDRAYVDSKSPTRRRPHRAPPRTIHGAANINAGWTPRCDVAPR